MSAAADLFARLNKARQGAEPAPPTVPTLPAVPVEIVPWEAPGEAQKAGRKVLEEEAKEEVAAARLEHARMLRNARRVVNRALDQLLGLLGDSAWLATQGPTALANVTKLFEAVNKETRLDQGKSTENVAHAVTSFDPSLLSAEERMVLRKAMLRRAEGEEE